MNNDAIRQLLERLGRAINEGDLKDISGCWAMPALFLSDADATTFHDAGEIEQIMSQAIGWYRSRGLVSTRPDMERIDVLSEKLASVDVRWPGFDASGQEQSSERSHYILQLGTDDHPRIRVALTRTAQ